MSEKCHVYDNNVSLNYDEHHVTVTEHVIVGRTICSVSEKTYVNS